MITFNFRQNVKPLKFDKMEVHFGGEREGERLISSFPAASAIFSLLTGFKKSGLPQAGMSFAMETTQSELLYYNGLIVI